MASEGERRAGDHRELASENERLVGEDRDPAGADRDPADAVRMTHLERRAHLLLRVYPAAYRHERGEEIIGTLLETSADRTWPPPRDVHALVVAGLKARAAQNRQRTPGANLRVSVMVGVSTFLSLNVAGYLTGVVGGFVPNSVHASGWTGWPAAIAAVLTASTVLLAWTAPRAGVLVGALAASTALVMFRLADGGPYGLLVVQVLCLAGLSALARGTTRPSRHWLWLPGLIAVSTPLVELAVGYGWLGYSAQHVMPGGVLLAACLLGLAWIAVDARLILALLTYFAAVGVADAAAGIRYAAEVMASLPFLFVVATLGAASGWLVRRQSARAMRTS